MLGFSLDNLDDPYNSSYTKLAAARAEVIGTLWTDGTAWSEDYILRIDECEKLGQRPMSEGPVAVSEEFYPDAEVRLLTRNFTVGGAQPKIIVLHGTSGLGDPYNWWNREVSSDKAASADFWIPRATGQNIKQYVKLGDTSWSNGPLVKPDISVPFLRWLVEYKRSHPEATGNSWTTSIEFEKDTGNKQGLTAWQVEQGRKLIKWLSQELAIPLDRNHILGHYQFDSVSRDGCPGPMPWDELLSDYAALAERNYWGPVWAGINWARGKNRVTDRQQRTVHEMIVADKKLAGVE